METNRNIQPQKRPNKFSCPHCKVVAKQDWMDVYKISAMFKDLMWHEFLQYRNKVQSFAQDYIEAFCIHLNSQRYAETEKLIPSTFHFAKCQSCLETSIWIDETMIYPRSLTVPGPNEDMRDETKKLYLEAAAIFQDSPRASAALLRLCIEKLCNQLGEKGKLDKCIAALVQKGVNEQMQQALDYCQRWLGCFEQVASCR